MDEYEPIKVLGEGSFGKVYLMKHRGTRELVCTKVIKLKNIPKKEQEACRNEVELLQRMAHPNIVGYTTSILYRNCLCIVMEYCDAGDLGDRVNKAKGKLLPESKVMMWFVQAALGLHYMHSNRILHRDIKTQNVFILSSGRVVLGDLGISKVMEGTRDFASTCIGTPYYMSPEIFKNHPYNHKSDVWALGCLLYELLTLKHAFDAQSLNGLASKIIKGKFPPVSNDYSKNLRALVKDMLGTNPKNRPDIEQILRKSFVRNKVGEFARDLKNVVLPRQDQSLSSIEDQFMDLDMSEFLPANMTSPRGYEGINAPSPSQTGAVTDAEAAAVKDGRKTRLKAQKHELELEEEKRIATEMALNRLRKKAAERRRRASLSRPSSPNSGGEPSPRIGSAPSSRPASPRSPGSPRDKEEDVGTPSRSRRPSLLQRLGSLASNSLSGKGRRSNTTSSPQSTAMGTGKVTSSSTPTPRAVASRGASNVSDVDVAIVAAMEAASAMEESEKAGVRGEAPVKGPTGPPRRSLSRPKEAIDYITNPTPRRKGSLMRGKSRDGEGESPSGFTGVGLEEPSSPNLGQGPSHPARDGQVGTDAVSAALEGRRAAREQRGSRSAEPGRRSLEDRPSLAAKSKEYGDLPSVNNTRASEVSAEPMPSSFSGPRSSMQAPGSPSKPEDPTKRISAVRRPSPDLPQLGIGGITSPTPALRSGRSPSPRPEGAGADPGVTNAQPPNPPPRISTRPLVSPSGTPRKGRSRSSVEELFDDEEQDFFQHLKEQTRAKTQQGEDEDVHNREEALEERLREAEARCKELQQTLENARAAARRGSVTAVDLETLAAMGLAPVGIEVKPAVGESVPGMPVQAGPNMGHLQVEEDSCSILSGNASDFEEEPSPYCQSHLSNVEDPPTPVGKLVDRVQVLRKKCVDGLGEENFQKAFSLLTRIQEEDCRVELDGVVYDGNDDDQVKAMLVKVIGSHKLHYWNIMDQLLLMEA